MVRKHFDPARILSNREFRQVVHRIYTNGCVTASRHAQERMSERDFSARDVQHILFTGLIEEASYDADYGCCRYRIRGKSLDSRAAAAVAALMTEHRMVLITVFGVE